jgi:alpha-tubulin suppressor-like RCC1 family protein
MLPAPSPFGRPLDHARRVAGWVVLTLPFWNGCSASHRAPDAQVEDSASADTTPSETPVVSESTDVDAAQVPIEPDSLDSGSIPVERCERSRTVPQPTVAMSYRHTCVLRRGDVYCWGDGTTGELGLADPLESLVPLRVTHTGNWDAIVAGYSVSGGGRTCALRCGSLYCWGHGRNDEPPAPNLEDNPKAYIPTGPWETVVTGASRTCALRSDGALGCWQAGVAPETAPAMLFPSFKWTQVSTYQYYNWEAHSCGISEGQLFCWGGNDEGELGVGDQLARSQPTLVDAERRWQRVVTTYHHSCGLSDGRIFCWGRNREGQVITDTARQVGPYGFPEHRLVPTPIDEHADWTEVAVSDFISCGLRTGRLYCWGVDNPALGVGRTGTFANPILQVGEAADWELIALTRERSCGVRAGELYCWGDNREGQLGVGDLVTRDRPTRVLFPD